MKRKLLYSFKTLTLIAVTATVAMGQVNYTATNHNYISGDFDNDGSIDDIITLNTENEKPSLLLWTSENNSMTEKNADYELPFDMLTAEKLDGKLVAGDFDNDGFMDDFAAIYEIGHNQTSITVWLNNKGKFTPSQWWYGGDFDANQTIHTVVSGDFDNDGFHDDIAAFYDYLNNTTKVFVWKSAKDKFQWPGTWWVGNDFNSSRIQGTMVAGDFDHDGFVDDIAGIYDYADNYTKIFVWTTAENKFRWPYTWYQQADFAASNIKGNVVAGDFNHNGYVDNIAAFYKKDESASEIMVWEKQGRSLNVSSWWYGYNEAKLLQNRLVSIDTDGNGTLDEIVGMKVEKQDAQLMTWKAENKVFTLPQPQWKGMALNVDEDCEEDGKCLSGEMAQNIALYPNPTNGNFNVEVPQTNDEELQVIIYNLLGSKIQQLMATPGEKLNFDLTRFDKGTYLVQIVGKEIQIRQNVIVE